MGGGDVAALVEQLERQRVTRDDWSSLASGVNRLGSLSTMSRYLRRRQFQHVPEAAAGQLAFVAT
jgi:hypothetical protein